MGVRKTVGVTASAVVLGIVMMPAAAHAASPAAKTKSPNVQIKDNKDPIFSPSSETVQQGTGTTCTTTDYSVSIQNKTKVAQELQVSGDDFVSISPKTKVYICQGVGTITYGLASNAAATFTLTVTANSG